MYTPSASRYAGTMTYRRCGLSGIQLPVLSLGFWHNFGEVTPEDQSRAIARAAFDMGICHFDLANNYGPAPGAAEERLGKMLRDDFRGHRDELLISTKAAYDMWEGPYGTWASRKHLVASLNQSLRRMGLDYVDIFYCHRYDPATPLEETLQALTDIVRAGKALYVGLSRWPREAAAVGYDYLRSHDVPCLIYQGRLNLFDRGVTDGGDSSVLALCRHEGVGFIGFSPLAQGLLTDRYLDGIPADSRMAHDPRYLQASALTPARLESIRRLNAIARQRGETLATMALTWALQQDGVTSLIVGASSPQQLVRNAAVVNSAPLTPEELQAIEAALQAAHT